MNRKSFMKLSYHTPETILAVVDTHKAIAQNSFVGSNEPEGVSIDQDEFIW